jgi:putative transposase
LPVHIIQRGSSRQLGFAAEADGKACAHWLHEGSLKCAVDVHARVFMTHHVHLLFTPHAEWSVSRLLQYEGRYYVRYLNLQYRRSGALDAG